MDSTPRKIPVVAWAPFFERAKFRYWKDVGRGMTIIDKNGIPRTEFYNDAHVSGGSIWTRILPEGEVPEGQPDETHSAPKPPPGRSAMPSDSDDL
jgi:hypothetical protein